MFYGSWDIELLDFQRCHCELFKEQTTPLQVKREDIISATSSANVDDGERGREVDIQLVVTSRIDLPDTSKTRK